MQVPLDIHAPRARAGDTPSPARRRMIGRGAGAPFRSGRARRHGAVAPALP